MPDLTPAREPGGGPGRAGRPVAAPVDILLVDDHPAKLTALESALAPLGQNLVSVTSGREALRQLLTHDFATIILDVNMPVMDGFETAQLIRGRTRSAHTPIIFVSSVNLAETDALRGYSLGAVDYILAPIVPEILLAKVGVFVELHQKTQEARLRAAELEQRTRELQESQEQLRAAERFAALGTLSAGLGHDMGNALLPIQARLESLSDEGLSPEAREILGGVRSCVGYLRRLAQGLRMLSRAPDPTQSGEHASTDLHSWWEDLEPMLRNAIPAGLVLRHELGANLPPARLERHLLSQIVFNLVQNAGDALRERGRGTVTVIAAADAARERIVITVADDGPGMPPEVQARCFDPFFSTKPRALSTGLGLAFVHGIVQRAGGEIAVSSRPGHGTEFCCTIPAAPTAPGPAASQTAYLEIADPRIRGFVASILGARGLKPTPAAERERAVLWVCDAASVAAMQAPNWAAADPSRRVLLLGPASAAPSSDGPPGQMMIDPSAGMAELRRALREALAPDAASPPFDKLVGAAAT